jgi:glucose-6-phosphate isomerase
MTPFGVEVDSVAGTIRDAERVTVRRASDMVGYYQDIAALDTLIADGDPVHYEVFEKPVPLEYGHLMFCVSKLYPGTVGDECFMTKGHYHTIAETAEIYYCIGGQGFMLMKTPDGLCVAEPMRVGRLVYVPPYWAHRSINTGDVPLVSVCSYPAEAGHNYGDIEEQGFPKRVFLRNGTEVIA